MASDSEHFNFVCPFRKCRDCQGCSEGSVHFSLTELFIAEVPVCMEYLTALVRIRAANFV